MSSRLSIDTEAEVEDPQVDVSNSITPHTTVQHVGVFRGLLQDGDTFQKSALRQDIEKYRREYYNKLVLMGTHRDRVRIQNLTISMEGIYTSDGPVGNTLAVLPVVPVASIDEVHDTLRVFEQSPQVYTCSIDDIDHRLQQLEEHYL